MIALAIDPSLSCTGIALVQDAKPGSPMTLLGFATCKAPAPEKMEQWYRVMALREAVKKELDRLVPDFSRLDVVAVEMPMTVSGRGQVRSTAHLPIYGMSVAAVAFEVQERARGPGVRVDTPAANHWGRMVRTGGKGKPGRVEWAKCLLGGGASELDRLSAERKEAIADAICLASWSMTVHRLASFKGA